MPLGRLIALALASTLAAADVIGQSARREVTQSNGSDSKARAVVLFEQGQTAHSRGDLNSAVRFYSGAIAIDQSIFQIYYQRAIALIGLGRASEAERDLNKVLELEASFARAHRALGQILLDRGETDAAKARFASALELDPNLADVRLYYASALLKSGDAAKAAEEFRTAIQQGEESALAWALLGVAEERLGKLSEAFASFTHAIEINPREATAREGRARFYEARGDLDKAIEEYTAAHSSQPSPEIALKLAELYRKAGQLLAAVKIYRQLATEKPEEISFRAEIIDLMLELGQVEEAHREVEALLASQPRNVSLLVMAGEAHSKSRPDLAAGFFRRALDADPANNGTRVRLGACLVRSRHFSEAAPILEEALARDPNSYEAHANLATALFELKQYPRAAGEFLWVVRARPEAPVGYYFLAISLDRMGDCEQGLRAYREFLGRADPSVNKREIDDATIRVSLLERLAKDGKCKSPAKRRGK